MRDQYISDVKQGGAANTVFFFFFRFSLGCFLCVFYFSVVDVVRVWLCLIYFSFTFKIVAKYRKDSNANLFITSRIRYLFLVRIQEEEEEKKEEGLLNVKSTMESILSCGHRSHFFPIGIKIKTRIRNISFAWAHAEHSSHSLTFCSIHPV